MAAAGLGVALIAVVLIDAGGSGENSSDDDAAMRIESEDADFAGGEFQSAPEGAPADAAAESGETTAAIGIPEEQGAGTPDGEDAERSSADADADEGGGEEADTTMSLQASALISEPIIDASDLPAVAPGPTLDADSYIVPTPNTESFVTEPHSIGSIMNGSSDGGTGSGGVGGSGSVAPVPTPTPAQAAAPPVVAVTPTPAPLPATGGEGRDGEAAETGAPAVQGDSGDDSAPEEELDDLSGEEPAADDGLVLRQMRPMMTAGSVRFGSSRYCSPERSFLRSPARSSCRDSGDVLESTGDWGPFRVRC